MKKEKENVNTEVRLDNKRFVPKMVLRTVYGIYAPKERHLASKPGDFRLNRGCREKRYFILLFAGSFVARPAALRCIIIWPAE